VSCTWDGWVDGWMDVSSNRLFERVDGWVNGCFD
jgi:hypothetical protein